MDAHGSAYLNRIAREMVVRLDACYKGNASAADEPEWVCPAGVCRSDHIKLTEFNIFNSFSLLLDDFTLPSMPLFPRSLTTPRHPLRHRPRWPSLTTTSLAPARGILLRHCGDRQAILWPFRRRRGARESVLPPDDAHAPRRAELRPQVTPARARAHAILCIFCSEGRGRAWGNLSAMKTLWF